MSDKSVNINVTPEEANYILAAMSHRPFAEVFNLLMKVKAQVEAQAKPEDKSE